MKCPTVLNVAFSWLAVHLVVLDHWLISRAPINAFQSVYSLAFLWNNECLELPHLPSYWCHLTDQFFKYNVGQLVLFTAHPLGPCQSSEWQATSPRLSSCFFSSLTLFSFPLVSPSPITSYIISTKNPQLVPYFQRSTFQLPADHLPLANFLSLELKISKSNQIIITSFPRISILCISVVAASTFLSSRLKILEMAEMAFKNSALTSEPLLFLSSY